MNTNHISTVAIQLVDGFDNTAHKAIDAWRDGAERLAQVTRERWDTAFKEASPQLSAETRRNATNARKVLGGYYFKGIELSTSGAEVAIDTVVQAARVAIERTGEALERAGNWQQTRA